jgi:antitoxin (DNA-binding transcriptional repressor) of toxin-antitoxin stability system
MYLSKISATDLARNLSTVIDQVRVARTRMTITKGNQDIAQIVPIVSSNTTIADLSQLLKANRLSKKQKQSFQADINILASKASLPASSWD